MFSKDPVKPGTRDCVVYYFFLKKKSLAALPSGPGAWPLHPYAFTVVLVLKESWLLQFYVLTFIKFILLSFKF
jgi:hypothetical protein